MGDFQVFDHIDSFLKIVAESKRPEEGFRTFITLCAKITKSRRWQKLPKADFERDVLAAMDWLKIQFEQMPKSATGVYLGIDTLNQNNGKGHNLEIGASGKCIIEKKDEDSRWLRNLTWYGREHLIYGLYEMKSSGWGDAVFEEPLWPSELYSFADYAVFLTYSGLVLTGAFEQLAKKNLLKKSKDKLIVWGFHDGDLFELGIYKYDSFERIATKPA